MVTEQQPSMFEWIFKPDTLWDRIVRVGFGGFLLAVLGTNLIKQVKPSNAWEVLVCLMVFLLLLVPSVTKNPPPRDPTLRAPTIALGFAYVWMALLYFFNATQLIKLPVGY